MATRVKNKLTATQISKGKFTPNTKVADGGGLYLNIAKGGTKTWVMIITRNGQRREIGLGSINDVTLEEARRKRDDLRAEAARGKDVLEAKRAERGTLTFRQASDRLCEAMRHGWKGDRHYNRWQQVLNQYCTSLAKRPIREVNVADVLQTLKPVWMTKPTTAKIVLTIIRQTISWAAANNHRDPNLANPADWTNVLKYLLSSPKNGRHYAAMPYAEIGDFVKGLRDKDTTAARCFELIILTWCRKAEAREAVWSEIDFKNALWTIPAERMKQSENGDHIIPLSKRALEIFRAQHTATGGKGFVFPGRRKGTCISPSTLNLHVPEPYTVHGMRSAARDWAGNETVHMRETAEECLAHAVGNSTERAYRRSTAIAKRRALLDDWATFVGRFAAPAPCCERV